MRLVTDNISAQLTFIVRESASGLATLAIRRAGLTTPTTIESHEDWDSAFDQYVEYVEQFRAGRREFPFATDQLH